MEDERKTEKSTLKAQKAVHSFDLYESLRSVSTKEMGMVLQSARALVPLFLLGVLIYSYAKSILMEAGPRIDFSLVIRGFIFFFLLLIYPELTQILDMLSRLIYGSLPQQPGLVDSLSTYNELIWKETETPIDGETGFWNMIWDSVSGFGAMVWASITSAIAGMLIVVVREGMSFVRVILLNFLYMVGPIALLLSIVPGFKESSAIWLKGYLGVSLWEFTLRVLDFLIYQFNLQAFDGISVSDSTLAITAFQLVCVVMYLLTPTITNYFLRVGSVGAFVGKASGVATTAMLIGARRGKKR